MFFLFLYFEDKCYLRVNVSIIFIQIKAIRTRWIIGIYEATPERTQKLYISFSIRRPDGISNFLKICVYKLFFILQNQTHSYLGLSYYVLTQLKEHTKIQIQRTTKKKKKEISSTKINFKYKNYLNHFWLTESKPASTLPLFLLKPSSHTNLLKKERFYINMLFYGPPAIIRMSISQIQMFFLLFTILMKLVLDTSIILVLI